MSEIESEREHWSDLAGSEFLGMLTGVYLILFMVKTCCQDWGQQYLLEERGVSAYPASNYLVAMEIGGLVGSIVLGALTDHMIRSGVYARQPEKSARMIMVELCVAGSALFLNLFLFSLDSNSTKVMSVISSFGFFNI